jgi:hypothetical protein
MTTDQNDSDEQDAPRWRVRLAERAEGVDVSLTLDADGSSLVLELTDEQATLLSRDLILAADRARFTQATRTARAINAAR